MGIILRKVKASDKERILEISSRIWGGHDYIPSVFDEWLNDPQGFFACVELDGSVAGFGRCLKVNDEYFWLEGLRTDPKLQGHGVGKVLTDCFIEYGAKENAKTLALSTYIDNKASIHIIEKSGFKVVANFVYFETRRRKIIEQKSVKGVENININPAMDFIVNSKFIKLSKGYFPYGWKFVNVKYGLKTILNKADFIYGFKKDGKIAGLVCGAEVIKGFGNLSVFFIDGEREAVSKLAKAVFNLKSVYSGIEFMIPTLRGETIEAFEILKKFRIRNYNKFVPDVFVYEKTLR